MKQAAQKPFSLVSYRRWTTSLPELSQARPARRVRHYPGYCDKVSIAKDASSSPQIMTLLYWWWRLLGNWWILWPSRMKVVFVLNPWPTQRRNIVIYDDMDNKTGTSGFVWYLFVLPLRCVIIFALSQRPSDYFFFFQRCKGNRWRYVKLLRAWRRSSQHWRDESLARVVFLHWVSLLYHIWCVALCVLYCFSKWKKNTGQTDKRTTQNNVISSGSSSSASF